MVKSQLIEKITKKQHFLSEQDVSLCVNKMLDLISQTLINGDNIEIRGFGSFSVRYYGIQTTINPKTGKKFAKKRHRVHFKPGKELRERVDK